MQVYVWIFFNFEKWNGFKNKEFLAATFFFLMACGLLASVLSALESSASGLEHFPSGEGTRHTLQLGRTDAKLRSVY
jgi:hypothetical protein